jgi:hypothetical protein
MVIAMQKTAGLTVMNLNRLTIFRPLAIQAAVACLCNIYILKRDNKSI